MLNLIIPKTDITKLKYELDRKFNIVIKTKIEIRITIIFIETNNNVFE